MNNTYCLFQYADSRGRQNLLPGDFEAQFNGPEVINIHGDGLGQCSKKVLRLAGNTSYNHVIG